LFILQCRRSSVNHSFTVEHTWEVLSLIHSSTLVFCACLQDLFVFFVGRECFENHISDSKRVGSVVLTKQHDPQLCCLTHLGGVVAERFVVLVFCASLQDLFVFFAGQGASRASAVTLPWHPRAHAHQASHMNTPPKIQETKPTNTNATQQSCPNCCKAHSQNNTLFLLCQTLKKKKQANPFVLPKHPHTQKTTRNSAIVSTQHTVASMSH